MWLFSSTYTLLALIGVLFWYFSISTFNHWKNLNVKYKPPIPFFGNTAAFALLKQSFHESLADIYYYFRNEPFGGYFFTRIPTLFVKEPDLINHILIKDFKHFVNRGFDFAYPNKDLNPISGHLFLVDGERWRILRNKMSPIFTSGKLKLMYEQIFDCVKILNQFIENEIPDNSRDINLKELFERFTIDVIGTCAFGLECNSLKDGDEFRTMGVAIFKPTMSTSLRMLLTAINKKLLNVFKIPDLPKHVSDFFVNVVLNTVTYRRKNRIVRNDFLQLLMELQNTSINPKYRVEQKQKSLIGEEFDETDIAANAFLFFAAGFETTASTLSFCLHELAVNRGIQEKLRQEVETVKTRNGGELRSECLKEFNYMDMVIAETLRKYPPLPVLFRECCEDYVIPDTKICIKTGTKLIIPVWSIQHDWKYYPNPEQFDPDRFSAENKANLVNGTYLPFGDGPRYCIGKRFAFMEIKAALADIICRYDFCPCNETEIPLRFKNGSILMTPRNGVWLNISKR